MKNFYSKLMLGFLLLSTSTINAQTTTYCVPSQTPQHWISASAEPITSVVLSQGSTILINQQSTSSVSASTPKYEDYSSIVASVVRGESYTLKVKGNTDGNNNCYITLYIDWNGDGVFSNSTPTNLAEQQAWTQQKEKHQHIDPLVNTAGEDNVEIEYNLNIPTDAFLGQTRIRVVKNYQAPSNASCENAFSFGQVEDYTLNITEASTVHGVEVTTQNNVPAVINTANGTLQLNAKVSPTATASQNVTWSVISGVNTVSVSSTGLVTGLINNGSAIVRATSVDDTTKLDEIQINVAVPQQAATLDYTENFETDADWTYVNQTDRTTKWTIGDAVTNGTGSKALYVSNDDGLTNSTDHSIMLTVHAYRDIQIPAGTTNTELSFDWKAEGDFYNGGWGYSVYNYMEVWIVPTSYTPAGGSLITAANDRIKIQGNHQDGNFLEQSVFTTYNNNNLDLSAYAGQNVRLVFSWKNINGSAGTPAAIDNFSLKIPVVCADPGPNPGDTGCVTFTYNGTSVTYTTVRGADNQIWLQQNLGSTQVATSASDAASYGDYFQWGRWVDGHQAVNSTLTATPPTPNNPSGIANGSTAFYSAAYNSPNNWWSAGTTTDSWSAALPSSATSTDGCDPCKAIGTGWRLPTISEIGTMITSENLSNVGATGAFASNLKIPASGTKDYSGMFSQGTRSYFWSSTPIYTGSAESFYSGLAVTVEGSAGRDTGIPIRCIYQAAVNVSTVAVTTQNNVAATITTVNGTLQLEAAITPTTANQAVTWSVQSGNTSATVDNAGLVTGLTNGTAVVRATSVADTTKFGELTVTVNISTTNPCTAVQSFLETFETFTTFPENCWTGNYLPTPPAPAITIGGTATNKTVSLYSGFVTGDIIIASPEVSTIDGQHVLGFDIVSFSDATTSIQVGTLSDNTDFTTFAPVGTPISPSVGTHTSIAIPANAGHKYVAIKFIHGGGHKALQLDNIEWKTAASSDKFDADKVKIYPNPTTGMLFIDTYINVKSIDIYNTSGQRILTTNQKNINLENAANGLYIVNVYAVDGTHASYKIIKK